MALSHGQWGWEGVKQPSDTTHAHHLTTLTSTPLHLRLSVRLFPHLLPPRPPPRPVPPGTCGHPQERELQATVHGLRGQLDSTQQQLQVRQALVTSLHQAHTSAMTSGTPTSSSTAGALFAVPGAPLYLTGHSHSHGGGGGGHGRRGPDGRNQADADGAMGSPRSVASGSASDVVGGGGTYGTRVYGGGVGEEGPSLSEGHSTMTLTTGATGGRLALGPGGQQYGGKVERVVVMWRDACRAKDLRIQELQMDLAAAGQQLERARAQAGELMQQVRRGRWRGRGGTGGRLPVVLMGRGARGSGMAGRAGWDTSPPPACLGRVV